MPINISCKQLSYWMWIFFCLMIDSSIFVGEKKKINAIKNKMICKYLLANIIENLEEKNPYYSIIFVYLSYFFTKKKKFFFRIKSTFLFFWIKYYSSINYLLIWWLKKTTYSHIREKLTNFENFAKKFKKVK